MRLVIFSEGQGSTIDLLDNIIEANLTRAERLRQAVLRSAFSGTLPLSECILHHAQRGGS